jgi:hypothetical protein
MFWQRLGSPFLDWPLFLLLGLSGLAPSSTLTLASGDDEKDDGVAELDLLPSGLGDRLNLVV